VESLDELAVKLKEEVGRRGFSTGHVAWLKR